MKEENNNLTKIDETTVSYLTLIQEPIARMSTTSAVFKGFAATVFAGFSMLTSKTVYIIDGSIFSVEEESSLIVLILSIMSILIFMSLDIYYLQLERKFRYLYNCVISKKHPCDFRIEPIKDKEKEAKARFVDCIKSPSIYLFYGAMIIIEVIIYILKKKGVM